MTYLPSGLGPDEGEWWARRHQFNVPGPVYIGHQTEASWTGWQHAPGHVLYGGEYYDEFVFRQPKSRSEVEVVAAAAVADPDDGYGFDGDQRWTLEAVRAWWSDRHRLEEDVMDLIRTYAADDVAPEMLEAAQGAREFLEYIRGGLETDLRAYLFRLEQGHYPLSDDELPGL